MFKKRHLIEGDIFLALQKIRRKKGISLDTIHKQTKIPKKFLRALEEGSKNMLPDVLYIKNIIKKYSEVLGIDPAPFIAKLDIKKTPKQYPQKALNKKSLLVIPRIIKLIIAVVLIGTLIIYLIFMINKIFKPPTIIIETPKEGQTVFSSIIDVIGKTKEGTRIFINDEPIVLDNNFQFKKELNLQKGLNLIKITGISRYSKEKIIWRNVILEIK